MTKSLKGRPDVFSKLDADDAFIALLIAAMDPSGHESAEEAARAHNIIWSMRRFRHRFNERTHSLDLAANGVARATHV